MGLFDSLSGLTDNTAAGNPGGFTPYRPEYGGFGGTGNTPFEQLQTNIGEGFGKIGDIFGGTKFNQAMGGFSTLMDMYTGFKSLGLAKDQFQFQKKAWNKNYQAQLQDYENTLKDRWAIRNASAQARGTTYQGMNDWVSSRMPGG